jgi:hypothetical protein
LLPIYNPDERGSEKNMSEVIEYGFGEDADKDYPVAPIGEGLCEVTSAESKVSSSGNPMIALELVHLDSQAKLFDYITFTKKAESLTYRKLRALGFDVAPGKPFRARSDDFLSRRVLCLIKHETYEGKVRAKIDEMREPAIGSDPSKGAPIASSEVPF